MRYWGPVCVVTFFVWLVFHFWSRLSERDAPYTRRWLIEWTLKGLALPIAAWIYLNYGTTPILPPMVKIAVSKTGSYSHFAMLWAQIIPGLVNISSDWAALTLGWFAVGIVRRMEERRDFLISCFFMCALLSPFVGILLYCYGLGGAGFAMVLWFWPVTQYGLSLKPRLIMPPSYTRAVAKMKFGRYSEAEAAIIQELEKCENDFAGWMMLAELYANHFKDIAEAERTICELCDEPNTTQPQVAIALHRLADWQLKLRQDPAAARRVLEEICKRMPDTHLERMARLRIQQLPADTAELEERQKVKTVSLPASTDSFEIGEYPIVAKVDAEQALLRANRCVEILERDPNDVAVREELAGIFAEQLGQLDLAIEQLELLIAMPQQPDEKIAACLGTMADWQLKYRNDEKAARKSLERIVHEFPRSPQAFPAQRKLGFLMMGERNRRGGHVLAHPPKTADKPA